MGMDLNYINKEHVHRTIWVSPKKFEFTPYYRTCSLMASIKFDMKIFVYQLPFKKISKSSLYIHN
jgi:hypothetical protein